MPRGPGISGIGVTVAAGGAYLMYAAIRDVPLLDGARQLLRGEVPAPRPKPAEGSWLQDIIRSPAGTPGSPIGIGGAIGSPAGGGAAGGDALANATRRYLGRPYRWGGTFAGAGGGDCSGLVWRSFHDLGVTDVPRMSAAQAAWPKLRKVGRADVRAGDLLYWTGHIAVAVNSTQMIEAPTFGVPVRIAAIRAGALCLRYTAWES